MVNMMCRKATTKQYEPFWLLVKCLIIMKLGVKKQKTTSSTKHLLFLLLKLNSITARVIINDYSQRYFYSGYRGLFTEKNLHV